jgi:putative hydrolase of the HAD superfamily
MSRGFEFICVDAVGTLLRVKGSVGAVYAPVAARHGLRVEAAAIDAGFRAAMSAAPAALFPGAAPAELPAREREWWRAVVARTLAPHDRVPGFDAFFAEVFELFRTATPWELLPGAREALVGLRAEGRRLGIVSDMDGRLHDVLTALDLVALFDCIALAPREGVSKNDGALFCVALARVGVAATRTCHIGDSLGADVGGARAAGIAPILFEPGARPSAAEQPVVGHWSDVPALLRALEGERR